MARALRERARELQIPDFLKHAGRGRWRWRRLRAGGLLELILEPADGIGADLLGIARAGPEPETIRGDCRLFAEHPSPSTREGRMRLTAARVTAQGP